MSFLLPVAFWLQTNTAAPSADPQGDDIVVVARSRKPCAVSIADRIISDREFRNRAREWAGGRPVRVTVPRGSSYKCMAQIMIRLGEYGVRNAVFIDR